MGVSSAFLVIALLFSNLHILLLIAPRLYVVLNLQPSCTASVVEYINSFAIVSENKNKAAGFNQRRLLFKNI